MEVSQEFEIALNLVRKFSDILKKIAESEDPATARPLIESVKHPMTNALFQIKTGQGPMKEEFVKTLTVIVSQMRELTNLEDLKSAIKQLLSLTEKVSNAEASHKEGKGG